MAEHGTFESTDIREPLQILPTIQAGDALRISDKVLLGIAMGIRLRSNSLSLTHPNEQSEEKCHVRHQSFFDSPILLYHSLIRVRFH